MWKLVVVCVLVALVSFSQCYKKEFVEQRPAPMKNFIPEKAAGRWYIINRFIPCNWQGSREFTDIARDLVYIKKENAYKATSVYRSGDRCEQANDLRVLNKDNCAVYFVKDRIGELYTGERIVVATDYKRFLIQWGCLRYSQDRPDVCLDVTMSIKTRKPHPSHTTRMLIDKILKKLFNLILIDLDETTQDNPC